MADRKIDRNNYLTCSWGGTDSRSDVGDEILDVDGLEALGKKARPERLHGDVGGLQDGRDLLGLKINQIKNFLDITGRFSTS